MNGDVSDRNRTILPKFSTTARMRQEIGVFVARRNSCCGLIWHETKHVGCYEPAFAVGAGGVGTAWRVETRCGCWLFRPTREGRACERVNAACDISDLVRKFRSGSNVLARFGGVLREQPGLGMILRLPPLDSNHFAEEARLEL